MSAIWIQAAGYVLFSTVAPARPPAHQGDTLAWPLVWFTGRPRGSACQAMTAAPWAADQGAD